MIWLFILGPTIVALLATLPCFEVSPPLLLSLTWRELAVGAVVVGCLVLCYLSIVNFIFFPFSWFTHYFYFITYHCIIEIDWH